MLKNYLLIAFRNIRKNKVYSSINILGLAFGIAVCTIIYLYVSYENSFDKFNTNADNIYRLENMRYYNGGADSSAGCIALLGPTLKEEFPEVVDFTRLKKITMQVSANNNYFNEENIFWADSSFLMMFSYPLILGNPAEALADKYSAVLTIETADKYFGSENAIGKNIQIDGMVYKITGIAENVPPNSHIKFDILLSFNTLLNNRFCWDCNNNNTYIQVEPGIKELDLESKLPLVVEKLHKRQKDGFSRAYLLRPLTSIHLYSNLRFEFEKNGNAETIYFLSIIAGMIMLIAWINYINLSTARSLERAKEVGLRKIIGARFWTLVRQFLLESFIINLMAVSLSVLIVEITSSFWTDLVGIPNSTPLFKNTNLIMLLLGLVFVNPIVSGFYPAIVLSSLSLTSNLRGGFKNSAKGISIRKGLVIFQFAISVILIAGILVFEQQLSFMRNKNLGININQKLVVNVPANNVKQQALPIALNTFINDLKNKSVIRNATYSSVIPGMENSWVSGGIRHENQTIEQGIQAYFVYVAKNYLKFFNIDLICGRNFFESELGNYFNNGSVPKTIILNESAVKEFGFNSPEEALGATLYNENFKLGEVIGVIKDYHQQSLDKEIKPTIFSGAVAGDFLIFDISTEKVSKSIDELRTSYINMFPGYSFEYNFLDEYFDMQYKADIQTEKILGVFTFLSIFISCLGLVGLSTLMTIQRTKEIGVRKVLGASVKSLLILLSKEYLKWVIIANLIAWPFTYYIMNKWLQGFAYRISISWSVFIFSGGIVLLIAFTTVSFQAAKAASANPVESLKYD